MTPNKCIPGLAFLLALIWATPGFSNDDHDHDRKKRKLPFITYASIGEMDGMKVIAGQPALCV